MMSYARTYKSRLYGTTYKSNEWLDIMWKGKLVMINGKGRIKRYGKRK